MLGRSLFNSFFLFGELKIRTKSFWAGLGEKRAPGAFGGDNTLSAHCDRDECVTDAELHSQHAVGVSAEELAVALLDLLVLPLHTVL